MKAAIRGVVYDSSPGLWNVRGPFDFARRSSLYLTYHVFGDRRQRGMALLTLKQRYAAAGLEVGPRGGIRVISSDASAVTVHDR